MPEKRFLYSCSAHQKSAAISSDEGITTIAYLRSNPLKRAYFSLYRVKIEPFSSCRLIVFHICKPFLLTCQYSSFSSRCQDRTTRSMIYLIYTFLGNSAYYRNSEFNGNSVFNGISAFCSVSGGASRKYLISGRMPPEMKNT